MLGYMADELGRYLARLRFPKRVRVPQGIVKINLGSGVEVAEGWLNVDGSIHALLSGMPRQVLSILYHFSNSLNSAMSERDYIERLHNSRFVFYELGLGLPFYDNVADYVYSSHVLEHFYLSEARRLLGEIWRILKPGGTVRVCVPDLEHAISVYQSGRFAEALTYFFGESRPGHYREHHYMYNFSLIAELLSARGFTDIRRCEFQQGSVPDLNKLDNRPEETLYVEARKPA